MKLVSAHVQNFKCVYDSGSFKIDERATAFVGKNEAGKTALLQALSRLKPIEGADSDFDELDFPRMRLDDFEAAVAAEQAPNVLTTVWEIEEAEREALRDVIGDQADGITQFTCFKGYENVRAYDVKVDDGPVIKMLMDEADLLGDEAEYYKNAANLPQLRIAISKLEDPTQRQKAFGEAVLERFPAKTTAWSQAVEVLDEMMPNFAYFSQYMKLPGQVSINDLKTRVKQGSLDEGHRVFLALMAMVGETPDSLEKIDQFEVLNAKLEARQNKISNVIFKYWSQNRHLKVQMKFDNALSGDPAPFNSGYVLRTRIENKRHGVSTIFDDRSTGFVWFFSFLVWFSQVEKNYGENVIVLLDEPGLSLHAKAQSDLLRYFEEQLTPSRQVIYTTHSPFMIDPEHLLRARTVEDVYLEATEEDLGTKVGDEVLSSDKDTVFPLQAALGYEITQTLFIGANTLLVEGPAEVLYLPWFSRKLKELGRVSLDRRWTIAPTGGIGNVPAFVSLFSANVKNVAVLTDIAQGVKGKVRSIRESAILREGHVLSADSYAGKPEADVEDMIGDDAYADLVNRCYGLTGKKVFTLPAVGDAGRNTRVVKRVEDHFATLGPKDPEFDHFAPAEFLTQQGIGLELNGLEDALGRFEQLFKDLNALLN